MSGPFERITCSKIHFKIGEPMARSSKGAPAKHFQPQDHAHAAHQAEASRRNTKNPERRVETSGKVQTGTTDHPVEVTPRGPRKGQ